MTFKGTGAALVLLASVAAAQGLEVDAGAESSIDAGGVGDAPIVEPDGVDAGQAALVDDGVDGAPGALDGGAAFDAPDAGEPAESKALETVVVGTPERRTAGSLHTLSGARLKRANLDDPHAVLQAVPGVQVRGEDGFGLRPNIGLRGTNPDRSKKVTLMEDGVLLGPAPYSAPAAYYFPLVTRMEAVRVAKGPAAIVYGPQTVGGAIDFITRDVGQGLSAGFDGALGEYWYGKAHAFVSIGDERSGFLVEGVHLRSDGFKQLDGGGNTGFGRNEVMVKARHRIDTGRFAHHFSLKLGYSSEKSNETYLGLTDSDFRERPLRRYVASALDAMTWSRTQAALTHRLQAEGWTLTTVAYRNDLERSWRKLNRFRGAALTDVLSNPRSPRNAVFLDVLRGTEDSASAAETLLIGPNHREYVSQGLESVFRTSLVTGPVSHAVEARARYHFDSISRLHTEDAFLMREGSLVSAGEPTAVLVQNVDATHAVSLALTDALTVSRFIITPGLRAELIQSRSDDALLGTTSFGSTAALLPALGVWAGLTDSFGLLGGISRGFSPPAPGQPRQVQPELSWNAELGARFGAGGARLEAIGFFNEYSNLTDVCTFSNGCVNENLDRQFDAGRAHIYGLEVFGEKRWRLGGVMVPVSFAYTLTGSQMRQAFQSEDPTFGTVRAGDELPYVPRHQLNVTVGVEVWRVGAHAQLFFVDRMRERAGQGVFEPGWTTDAQLTLDAHLKFRLTDWAHLTFDARNLTDARAVVGRRPFGARPNAPRMLIGGISLNL